MQRMLIVSAALIVATSASAQAPTNNTCGSPLAVYAGVNPSPPNGNSGTFFTDVGATGSSSFGLECSTQFNRDVWFSYTAVRTGIVNVSTCTPQGFTAGS